MLLEIRNQIEGFRSVCGGLLIQTNDHIATDTHLCVFLQQNHYVNLLFQVVLLSGHLDSWDVGQGAMDDGGGAMISWEALSLIKDLGR